MKKTFFVVTVPQFGVNDLTATVVHWYVAEEDMVSVGEPLCALETSKAVFDIEVEAAGYVVHLVDIGKEVKVNEPIALIGASLEALKTKKKLYNNQSGTVSGSKIRDCESIRATQKAKEMAQRLNVDLNDIVTEGIIREKDVINFHERSSMRQNELLKTLSWDPSRRPVVIYGAGIGAVTIKECLDFQELYQVVCFIDDNPDHPKSLCQLPVNHSSLLSEILSSGIGSLACAIANADVRMRILGQCENMGVDLINVIHPRSYISPSVKMGKGNYIKANAVIETNTVIGSCCIIDNGAIIAHDNVIGDGCHIAPGVSMGSKIIIGEKSIIGIGASISTNVKIGREVIVSVGSSVTREIPDLTVVEGVPARIVGTRKLNR